MEKLKDQFGEEKDTELGNPSPADLEQFLPWACTQFSESAVVVVKKISLLEYVSVSGMSTSTRAKKNKRPSDNIDSAPAQPIKVDKSPTRPIKAEKSVAQQSKVEYSPSGLIVYHDAVIKEVLAYYDSNGNLIHIQFKSNPFIPRIIFQILNLIIQFYDTLTTVTINRGLDEYIVYELSKLICMSCITDVCLDNTSLKNKTHYSVLLEKQSLIRNLSLARCGLDDEAIDAIAAKLVYPLPASKTLSVLTLTSNKITDEGAKYLAAALRSNRRLYYLNMSDNQLSDSGVNYILNSLCEFSLNFSEWLESKQRYMEYLKDKNEMILHKAEELRSAEHTQKLLKKRSGKLVSIEVKKHKGMHTSECDSRSFFDLGLYMETATEISEKIMGAFDDPFSKSNTYSNNGKVNCYGNNSMSYLNFSYNDLTFITLKKLLNVLTYQKEIGRKPKGLVDVSIVGNLVPHRCQGLFDLEFILSSGFMANRRKISKRRQTSSRLFGNL